MPLNRPYISVVFYWYLWDYKKEWKAKDNKTLRETIISMDHLILAARNEGLGTCWIGAFNKKI